MSIKNGVIVVDISANTCIEAFKVKPPVIIIASTSNLNTTTIYNRLTQDRLNFSLNELPNHNIKHKRTLDTGDNF